MKTTDIQTGVVYEYNTDNSLPSYASEVAVVLDVSVAVGIDKRTWGYSGATFYDAARLPVAQRGYLTLLVGKKRLSWVLDHLNEFAQITAAYALGKTEREVAEEAISKVASGGETADVSIIAALPRYIRRTWEERDAAAIAAEAARVAQEQSKARDEALRDAQWATVRDALVARGIDLAPFTPDGVTESRGSVTTSVATMAAILGVALPQSGE